MVFKKRFGSNVTVKGFFKCGSKKYYSLGDGKLAVGVKYIDGNTYEFDQHGVLLQ